MIQQRGRTITLDRPPRVGMSLCLHCQEWSEDCQRVDAGESSDLTGDYCADCRETALCLLANADDEPIPEGARIELVRQFLAGRPASQAEAQQLGEWLAHLNLCMTLVQMAREGALVIAGMADEPCFVTPGKGAS